MVGGNERRARIAAVDENYRPANEDRRLRDEIRRERSSAYWFAATKWGILGMVLGILVGGVGMYYATVGQLSIAQDAMERARIMQDVATRSDGAEAPAPQPASAP